MANKKQFVNADEEFQPLLKQIYQENLKNAEAGEEHFPINVEPKRIICLRSIPGAGKKYAYVRPILGEYRLLTEARYFMVICSANFDVVPSIERKKWIILHEFCHAWFDEEKQDYKTRKHDIEDFTFLLKNPNPNTELVKNFKYQQEKMFTEKI